MCGGPAWKREVVPDHKFDFVDVRDFTDNGFTMRAKYMWLYLIVLKDFLVYVSDIFTAITMSTAGRSLTTQFLASCKDGCVAVPITTTKWLFTGCIIFSFLLLAYESRKARKIIASRDISYAFTNVMANNYYSLRSYDHFCFFAHISNSTTTKDDLVLFVFFTFKSWKRVLLADGPRQSINALTLYAIYLSKKDQGGKFWEIGKYFQRSQISLSILTVTTFFTVLVFAGSLLLLIAAGIIYIPLVCYIRGNLKEYVCHKVDKRISQIIKRRNKERLAKANELAKKEAMGDYSHLKNKRGELVAKPLPQPTLPNLSVDDDDVGSERARGPPSSKYTQDTYFAGDYQDMDYPPMPPYELTYGHYPNKSQTTFSSDMYQQQQGMYGYENESVTHLASGAAPFANQSTVAPQRFLGQQAPNYYVAEPQDIYQGITGADRRSPAPTYRQQQQAQNADPQDIYQGITVADRRSPAPTYRQPQQAQNADPMAGLAYGREYTDPVYNQQQQQQQQQRQGGHGYRS